MIRPSGIHFFFFIGLVAAIFSCKNTPKNEAADTILHGGVFFTADSLTEGSTALAILGGRIVAMGSDSLILADFLGEKTEKVDLQGAFAMPGLIEGHGHFEALGQSLRTIDLLNAESWQVALDKVAKQVETSPAQTWITGRGWHQEKWQKLPDRVVQGYPLHHDLSKISPNHPVVLNHASGHALIANARAMELAGITIETPDPVGGRILRDASGMPTGVFEENAMDPIQNALAKYRASLGETELDADFREATLTAAAHCLDLGITTFCDAGSSFDQLRRYRTMVEAGDLPIRLWAMVFQPRNSEVPQLSQFPWLGLGDGHLTVRAVKAYLDGALGSHGAWLLAPYTDKEGFYGQNTTPLDTVSLLADACKERGLQFCVHAIGDRGNRELLDLFSKKINTSTDHRWRIEHAQHLHPDDIPRFGQLGVIASMQAIHCTSDAPFVEKRLGHERAAKGAYPWRSILDSGGKLANGTDAPVESVAPMDCLYAACTRKRADSGFEFFPEQSMTRREALLSYTLWNAYAGFLEKEIGSLSVGKRADIAVFDTDLLRCEAEAMLKAKAKMTLLGGKNLSKNR